MSLSPEGFQKSSAKITNKKLRAHQLRSRLPSCARLMGLHCPLSRPHIALQKQLSTFSAKLRVGVVDSFVIFIPEAEG